MEATLPQTKRSVVSRLSDLLLFNPETPTGFLAYAIFGPVYLMLLSLIAVYAPALTATSVALSVLSIALILRYQAKGFFGSLILVMLTLTLRASMGICERLIWELGFFAAQTLGLFITAQSFGECFEVYESTTIAAFKDLEQLKEIHSTYTKEKTNECLRLQDTVAEREQEIASCRNEITAMKQMVIASAAQASSLAKKNTTLEEQIFTVKRKAAEIRPAPKLDQKMLKELNDLRVQVYQQKKVLEARPLPSLNVDERPAPPKKIDHKETVALKEKEKAAAKKRYYELLDGCNDLKAQLSKVPDDEALKEEHDETLARVKKQKAHLIEIDRELFSLKKELRDQGLLYS